MIPLYDRERQITPVTLLVTVAVAIAILVGWFGYQNGECASKLSGTALDEATPGMADAAEQDEPGFDARIIVMQSAISLPHDVVPENTLVETESGEKLAYLEEPRSVLIYQHKTKDSWPEVSGMGDDL